MSTHIITVHDRVPHSAAITHEQLLAYVRRTVGGEEASLGSEDLLFFTPPYPGSMLAIPQSATIDGYEDRALGTIYSLASREGCQPSAALARIAAEGSDEHCPTCSGAAIHAVTFAGGLDGGPRVTKRTCMARHEWETEEKTQ